MTNRDVCRPVAVRVRASSLLTQPRHAAMSHAAMRDAIANQLGGQVSTPLWIPTPPRLDFCLAGVIDGWVALKLHSAHAARVQSPRMEVRVARTSERGQEGGRQEAPVGATVHHARWACLTHVIPPSTSDHPSDPVAVHRFVHASRDRGSVTEALTRGARLAKALEGRRASVRQEGGAGPCVRNLGFQSGLSMQTPPL